MKNIILLSVILMTTQSFAWEEQPREITENQDIEQLCQKNNYDANDYSIRGNNYQKFLENNEDHCVFAAAIHKTKGLKFPHYSESVIVMNESGEKSSCDSFQYKNINIPAIDNMIFRGKKNKRLSTIKSNLCPGVKCFEASYPDGSGNEVICGTSEDVLSEKYYMFAGMPAEKAIQWEEN